jgi:hypothetical protein
MESEMAFDFWFLKFALAGFCLLSFGLGIVLPQTYFAELTLLIAALVFAVQGAQGRDLDAWNGWRD